MCKKIPFSFNLKINFGSISKQLKTLKKTQILTQKVPFKRKGFGFFSLKTAEKCQQKIYQKKNSNFQSKIRLHDQKKWRKTTKNDTVFHCPIPLETAPMINIDVFTVAYCIGPRATHHMCFISQFGIRSDTITWNARMCIHCTMFSAGHSQKRLTRFQSFAQHRSQRIQRHTRNKI